MSTHNSKEDIQYDKNSGMKEDIQYRTKISSGIFRSLSYYILNLIEPY